MAGYPSVALEIAREGRALADSIGDSFVSRFCRFVISQALLIASDVSGAVIESRDLITDADLAHDLCLGTSSIGLAADGRRPFGSLAAPIGRTDEGHDSSAFLAAG